MVRGRRALPQPVMGLVSAMLGSAWNTSTPVVTVLRRAPASQGSFEVNMAIPFEACAV